MKSSDTRQSPQSHVSGQSNQPLSRPAHALDSAKVIEELGTHETTGLSQDEASSRLAQHGSNDLGKEKSVNFIEILIAQVVNSMMLVSQ
jgi:Na+-exporting ATPase